MINFMKLHRITAQRYVDTETGTYFDFLSDTTEAEALQQAQMRLKQMLKKATLDDLLGTVVPCPRMGKIQR